MPSREKTRYLPFIIMGVVFVALLPIAIVIGLMASTGNESEDSQEPTVDPSPAAGEDAIIIGVIDFAFEPSEATVPLGQTVTFQNESVSTHHIHIDDTDVELPLNTGQVADWTPDEPGEYGYVCTIHPNLMTGTITVAGDAEE